MAVILTAKQRSVLARRAAKIRWDNATEAERKRNGAWLNNLPVKKLRKRARKANKVRWDRVRAQRQEKEAQARGAA